VGTLVDPENSLPHLFALMANFSVCASVIPDGVETTSGVSSSVYPLTTMVTNYLTPVLTEGSLTRWTEDGQANLLWLVPSRILHATAYRILVFRNYTSCSQIIWFRPSIHNSSIDATGDTWELGKGLKKG